MSTNMLLDDFGNISSKLREESLMSPIENCEHCQLWKVAPIYKGGGIVNLRNGNCLNIESGWFNMPTMDADTCSKQVIIKTDTEEPIVIIDVSYGKLTTEELVTLAKSEKDISKLREIIKILGER